MSARDIRDAGGSNHAQVTARLGRQHSADKRPRCTARMIRQAQRCVNRRCVSARAESPQLFFEATVLRPVTVGADVGLTRLAFLAALATAIDRLAHSTTVGALSNTPAGTL